MVVTRARRYPWLVPENLEVWIGLANVVPRANCELLDDGKGAFTHFLSLAKDADEYRTKVTRACLYYKLELVELEWCQAFAERHSERDIAEELCEIADGLSDPRHVIFGTFYTYPRSM